MSALQNLSRPLELDELPIDADGWGDDLADAPYLGDGEEHTAIQGMIAACERDHLTAVVAHNWPAAWEAAEEVENLTAMLTPRPYTDAAAQ
jgi:hypothetical protein